MSEFMTHRLFGLSGEDAVRTDCKKADRIKWIYRKVETDQLQIDEVELAHLTERRRRVVVLKPHV